MGAKTPIQWADSTSNPTMACRGCELWPTIDQLTSVITEFLSERLDREHAEYLVRRALKRFDLATDVYHARERVASALLKHCGLPSRELKRTARSLCERISRCFVCYAGRQHLFRGRNDSKPEKEPHKGYAEKFEKPKLFPGRMAAAAGWRDLRGEQRPGKPWLEGLPRLIFVSDMGDALSADIPFEFLTDEIIKPVTSEKGSRHIWLWLTKRPARMAEFAGWIKNRGHRWPTNLVAMTSVTARSNVNRALKLQEVPSAVRGLSVEPLREAVNIPLDGIDWVIVGGESGPGAHPFDLAWAHHLRRQCSEAGVAFFVKQLGRNPEYKGSAVNLSDPHGGDWDEWTGKLAALRVRQFPAAFSEPRSPAMRKGGAA